jgi:hypothetical protein
LVTADPVANQEIKMTIPQLYRTKDPATGKEWLYYNLEMSGNDWTTLEGAIDGMPVLHYERDASTDKPVPSTTQVLEVTREYTIPFTKAKLKNFQNTSEFPCHVSSLLQKRI